MNGIAVIHSALFCIFLFLCGCAGLEKNLDEKYQEVADIYEKARQRHAGQEEKTLSWGMAKSMMLENNLDLKRARNNLERAGEAKSQILWDLVPSLRLSANLSKALTELGTVNSEDVNFSVFSTINLPGLINLGMRRYGASLGEIKAGWDLQLKERELIISLRQLFLEYDDFQTRTQNIKKSQLWNQPENQPPLKLLTTTPEEIRLEQQAFNLSLTENHLSQRVSKVLGSYDYKWILQADGLPELPYVEQPLDLNRSKDIGVLLRQKQAADLEVLRLSELGVKLRYLPDLNFGVSAPPLYRSGNGVERTFSSDDLIWRASSYLTIDTSRRLSRQLKNVKRQVQLQNALMREQVLAQVQQASLAQEELQLVARELRLTELRIEAMDARPQNPNLEEIRMFLEKRFVLIERESSLRLKKAKIEGGFWLLDERQWLPLAQLEEK
jgi:hypothetical protein